MYKNALSCLDYLIVLLHGRWLRLVDGWCSKDLDKKEARFLFFFILHKNINELVHEISNNMVCVTSKGSDQPAHTRSLIRAFAHRLNIL